MKPVGTTESTDTKTVRGQSGQGFTDDDLKPIYLSLINIKKKNMIHMFVIIVAKETQTYLKIHGINNFINK